jgi:hypothetical protein
MKRRTLIMFGGLGAVAIILSLGVMILRGGGAASAEARDVAALKTFVAESGGTPAATAMGMPGSGDLLTDDGFRADVRQLREEHRADMDAWRDKYDGDRDSDEATVALQKIRDKHQTATAVLLKRHGVDTDGLEKARRAAQQIRGELKELLQSEQFRADLQDLRTKHREAIASWRAQYQDSRGYDAVKAMEQLRDTQRTDMITLLEKYGVELPPEIADSLRGPMGGGMFWGKLGTGARGGGPGDGACGPGLGRGKGSPERSAGAGAGDSTKRSL